MLFINYIIIKLHVAYKIQSNCLYVSVPVCLIFVLLQLLTFSLQLLPLITVKYGQNTVKS